MSLRSAPGAAKPGCPRNGARERSVIDAERLALRHALERAYPLAKQLAEILELEAIEPLATDAKRLRAAIGVQMAQIVGQDIDDPSFNLDDDGRGWTDPKG